ncbi:MAG: ECF transporter S component [Clostridia bacterium]|nr:ECF transporter S component [Clostridia bacterium]
MRASKIQTKNIVYFAILLALVVVLQVVSNYITFGPVSITLVLIPIVVGGILLGPLAGALLGLSFGIITIIGSLKSPLFVTAPALIIILALVKATAAGFFPALFYKLIAKKHPVIATYVASASAPIINTGIFILGCIAGITKLKEAFGIDETGAAIVFVFVGIVGINFFIEFGINILLTPAVIKIIDIVKGKIREKKAVQEIEDDEEEQTEVIEENSENIGEGNYEQEERQDSSNE